MPIPNLLLRTFASLAVSDANISSVASLRPLIEASSIGEFMEVSSRKSPKFESSSSPIGVDTVEDFMAIKKIMEYKS